MDSSQLLKGVLDTAVLAVLENEDGYGYDIVRRLREAGCADIGDATVYGTLRRLYAAGLLKTYVVPSEDGPHRKYYAVNTQGLNALQQHRGAWVEFATNMSRILGTPNTFSEGKSK
jgi:PadR family transcriptional regulator, regulatory protein PadR